MSDAALERSQKEMLRKIREKANRADDVSERAFELKVRDD